MPAEAIPTLPTRAAPPADADANGPPVSLENDGTDSNGNAVILASFLAGFSALIVEAAALFVMIRRRKEGSRENKREVPVNVVIWRRPGI